MAQLITPYLNNELYRRVCQSIDSAINELNNRQMIVLNVHLNTSSIPTIQIQRHPLCQVYIERGAAAYFSYGNQRGKNYKQGQFKLHGCRVVWKEERV